MGLTKLCLLSLLLPQEPPPVPGHGIASPNAVAITQSVAQDPVAKSNTASTHPTADGRKQEARTRLKAAEDSPGHASSAILCELAISDEVDIAARAAWLLGQNTATSDKALLSKVAKKSPHAEARLQALHAIKARADKGDTAIAMHALLDTDRRVRTLAIQLLGTLRRPATIEPLLAVLMNSPRPINDGLWTDVIAAVLTLSDLGATQHLLRMASATDNGKANGTGEALAYAFQNLSPKLGKEGEAKVLVAVLGHKQGMLRRYAITRLAELHSLTALHALEGRLAKEEGALRALIEMAISQIEFESAKATRSEADRTPRNTQMSVREDEGWWARLDPVRQGMVAISPLFLLAMAWMLRRLLLLRADYEVALAAVDTTQPPDEFLAEKEGDDEDYVEDAKYPAPELDPREQDLQEYSDSELGHEAHETVPSDSYGTTDALIK